MQHVNAESLASALCSTNIQQADVLTLPAAPSLPMPPPPNPPTPPLPKELPCCLPPSAQAARPKVICRDTETTRVFYDTMKVG